MDYEKAYKEALERARKYMDEGYTVLMPDLFPELRESEDERISKEIIHYILYKANGVSEEQEHAWISYLEKRKGQKKSLAERFRPDFPKVADFIENVDKLQKDWAIGILEHYLKWAVSSERECPFTWKELADAIQLGIDAMKE